MTWVFGRITGVRSGIVHESTKRAKRAGGRTALRSIVLVIVIVGVLVRRRPEGPRPALLGSITLTKNQNAESLTST